MKVYQKIAEILKDKDCRKELLDIEKKYFPDTLKMVGHLYIKRSTTNKLFIGFDYQHTDHIADWFVFDLIITPNFNGIGLKIKWFGNNNNRSKVQKYKPLLEDYFYDTWNEVLNQEYKGEN